MEDPRYKHHLHGWLTDAQWDDYEFLQKRYKLTGIKVIRQLITGHVKKERDADARRDFERIDRDRRATLQKNNGW